MDERIIAIRETLNKKVKPTLEKLLDKPVIENGSKRELMKVVRGPLLESVEKLNELNLMRPEAYREIKSLASRNPEYLRGNVVRGILSTVESYI